ncbi:virulence RhuM family protein [Nostoc sp. NIES-2111]
MTPAPLPQGEFLLYQTEDGRTRIQCRLAEDSLWLTELQIAELFEITKQTVNHHLKSIYEDHELAPEATVRQYLTVRQEGDRQVSRTILHYNLPAILAVGYRVRSHRGTQFRQWATLRLTEFLEKGFTLDDERLKNPPGSGQTDYFDELLGRIRDIRASERLFYQKILDIYATSVDYHKDSPHSQEFFATVQNKMHFAAHGHTAAEVIHARANSKLPFMGLQSTRPGGLVRKQDVSIAKNYLNAEELETLNRIVSLYLDFAELQASNRRPMTMRDWIAKLDDFLRISDREILAHAGRISAEVARAKAELEFTKYQQQQDALPRPVDTHFEQAIRQLESARPRKKPKSKGSGAS